MPRFDEETDLRIVSLMPDLSYNEATGIITLQFVGEEPEDYRTQTITCEGEAVEVYEIGGGWTWYRVKFPETEDDDPLGQKANGKSFLFLSSDFPDHPAAMECQSGRRLTGHLRSSRHVCGCQTRPASREMAAAGRPR
jgi:hypothetical protein